jgi:hypothetical protein
MKEEKLRLYSRGYPEPICDIYGTVLLTCTEVR